VPSRRRRMMANVRVERLLKIPAEPSPELLIPGAAAQTRLVSMAGIRLRASSAGVARASIPAEILAYARAAYPQRRSSNANSLQSQNSAGFLQICAIFQRDILPRHFRVRVLLYRGGFVSSAFRLLRRSDVGSHSQGPRFSSGSALGPSHDGIRRMRRTNLQRRPCHKTYGRHQDSKRTRLIHRPAGDIVPPVGGIHVSPVSIVHNSL